MFNRWWDRQKLIQKDSFKLLHDDIQIFYDKNKNWKKNELTHLFDGFCTRTKFSLYYSDDAISYLKTILLLKNYFKKYALLIKKAIGNGMPYHILSIYEYAINVLHDRNIVKKNQYLKRNRETLPIDNLQ